MSITDNLGSPAIRDLFRELDERYGPPSTIEEDWPIADPAPRPEPTPLSLAQQLEIAEREFNRRGGWNRHPWGDYKGGNQSAAEILELRRQVRAGRDRARERAMDDLGPDYPHGDYDEAA